MYASDRLEKVDI